MRKFKSSIHSSPKLSASLRSSIAQVNDQIDNLCLNQQELPKKNRRNNVSCNIPVMINSDTSISTKMFTFDESNNESNELSMNYNYYQRPMTAPNIMSHDSSFYSSSHNSGTPSLNGGRERSISKKPYLKRKKRPKLLPKKVDWSYVKPKTVSRLSDDIRASRISNNNRAHYKPNVINWKEKATSRVDCGRSTINCKPIKKVKHRKKRNEFVDSYHHSNHLNKINKKKDDNYLYYLKKGNKIGKISRDSATAQLHDGSGPLILQSNSNNNSFNQENNIIDDKIDNVQVISSNNDIKYDECDEYDEYIQDFENVDETDDRLKELQQTFAAIEHAMKQRRKKQQQQQQQQQL